MVRPMLPFAGLALLFGGALIGAISSNHLPARKCASFPFTAVQQAVAQQRTVHISFRSMSSSSVRGKNYDAWLKANSPAFLVRTSEGQLIGDHRGVRYVEKGQQDLFLTKKPVTDALIRQKMLIPQFETDSHQAPSIHWQAAKQGADTDLVPFVGNDASTHRVLWLDKVTHLPMRLEIETHSDAASVGGASTAQTMRAYILYYYGENPPREIRGSWK